MLFRFGTVVARTDIIETEARGDIRPRDLFTLGVMPDTRGACDVSCNERPVDHTGITIRRIVQIGHKKNTISFCKEKDMNDLSRAISTTSAPIVQLGNNNVVHVCMGDKLPLNILVGDTVVVYVPPECNGRPRVFVCEQRGPDNQIVTQCHLKSPRIFERRRFANFRRPCCHVTRSVLLPTASGSSKTAADRDTTLTSQDCDVLTIRHGGTHQTHPRGRGKPCCRKYPLVHPIRVKVDRKHGYVPFVPEKILHRD
ncbi:uncharacterized protein LOC124134404 [Haliotis rufescens]|uniref:uncharacterized protein LOC124134404 n=1 Tax=Haliotis rufescens TaxID=6454 RepID=UPI00201F436F|nr:uncharacterized protein LOC124134404 [Haliotis rufescens]